MDANAPLLFFDSGVGGLSRARADARAAAQRADRLCRRQCRLSLWQAERGRDRQPRPGAARPAGRALPPAPGRDRLQHRLDHRARPCPRGARPAGRRHGPGDQAGGRTVEDPGHRRARHRGDRPPALCRRSRRASSPPTAPSSATARPSWSSWPRPSSPAKTCRIEAVRAAVAADVRRSPSGDRSTSVVLACTHFPLLRDELGDGLPGVALVDGGPGIARRIAYLTREQPGRPRRREGIAVFTGRAAARLC